MSIQRRPWSTAAPKTWSAPRLNAWPNLKKETVRTDGWLKVNDKSCSFRRTKPTPVCVRNGKQYPWLYRVVVSNVEAQVIARGQGDFSQ